MRCAGCCAGGCASGGGCGAGFPAQARAQLKKAALCARGYIITLLLTGIPDGGQLPALSEYIMLPTGQYTRGESERAARQNLRHSRSSAS